EVQLAIGLRDVPAEADRDTPFLFLSQQPDVADDEPATREVGDGALHRGRVLRRRLLLRLIRAGRGPRAEGEREEEEPGESRHGSAGYRHRAVSSRSYRPALERPGSSADSPTGGSTSGTDPQIRTGARDERVRSATPAPLARAGRDW